MKRKQIKDFENYDITETGVVFSNYINNKLSARINKGGYYYVNLYNKNGRRSKKIHRLVAEAFIPNPNNYPQVNHKDGNKLNNHSNNLEWCNGSMNIRHAFNNGLINLNTDAHKNASIKNGKEYRSKRVELLDSISGEKKIFYSATQCAEEMFLPLATLTSAIKRNTIIRKRYKAKYLINTLATTKDGGSKRSM